MGRPGCVGSRVGSRAQGARRGSHGCTGLADSGTGRLGGDGGALDPSCRDPGDLDTGHRRHPPRPSALGGDASGWPQLSVSSDAGFRAWRPTCLRPSGCSGSGWVSGGEAQPWGAEVTPENFPRTGCVGDFHRRPPQWGDVGRALRVIPVTEVGVGRTPTSSAPSHLTRRRESPASRSFGLMMSGCLCVCAGLWGRPWSRSCLLPFSLARLG